MDRAAREELQKRDRAARDQAMYRHPSSATLRDPPAGRQLSPAAQLARRQADETAEQTGRHSDESRRLRQKHESDRSRRLLSSSPMPDGYDRRQQAERDDMHERHARERRGLKDRHLVQRDQLRSKAAR